MKNLLAILLLTLSIPVLAGWTPPGPPSGGGGDSEAKATSTNFNTNTNLNGATSSSTQGQQQGQSAYGGNQGQGQGQIANGGNQHQSTKSKVKDSGNSNQSQASNSKGGNSANEYSSSYNSEATEATASSAPSISSIGCQVGNAAQIKDGGFSSLTASPFCQALDMARAQRISMEASTDPVERKRHEDKMHYYLERAGEYADSTYSTGLFAEKATQVAQGGIATGISIWLLLLLL